MRTPKKPPQVSDDELRQAYKKTALHRMGIPFERAIQLDAVRIPLEGSVRRPTHSPVPAQKTPPKGRGSDALSNAQRRVHARLASGDGSAAPPLPVPA